MTYRNIVLYTLAGASLLGLLPVNTAAQQFVPAEEEEFPVVQYPDSLYSLNDRCIVRLRKLNLRMPAAYVNGLPIGFC